MGNSQGKEIRTGRMTVRIRDILYEGTIFICILLIRLDSYWKVYLAQDVETNQDYDVRVATFDEGDMRSLNRLKQEISLWVQSSEILLPCRNTCQCMETLFDTMIPIYLKQMVLFKVLLSQNIAKVVCLVMS